MKPKIPVRMMPIVAEICFVQAAVSYAGMVEKYDSIKNTTIEIAMSYYSIRKASLS